MLLVAALIGITTFASSSNKKIDTTPHSRPIEQPTNKRVKQPININDIRGTWTLDRFVYSLRSSLSPYSALNEEVTELIISDTSFLSASYREGINLIIDYKANDTIFMKCIENEFGDIQIFSINDSTLKCKNCIRDTIVSLIRTANIHDAVAINNIYTTLNSNMHTYPEIFAHKYLSGEWKVIDVIAKTERKAKFIDIFKFRNGKVPDDFRLSFDFVGDIPHFDFVTFSLKDSSAYFHIKIHPDSISLYDIDTKHSSHADSGNTINGYYSTIGKLHYILTR